MELAQRTTPKIATVLIVDDNPTNLGVLTNYLKAYGYKTPIASNGELALRRARHICPDLILLDVLLPGIDGFETCRRLKADETTKDIPIIFMTALTSPEDKLKGFGAGGVDYIAKPFHQEEVLARVATHVHIRELTHHLQQQTLELAGANIEIRALNDRLRAENLRVSADLRESEYKYQTLVEEITDGYFVLQDERIVFANQAFCRMHGYQVDEVLGKEFVWFVDPESRNEVADAYRHNRDMMSVSHLFEYLRLTKTGESLFTEMTAKTIPHEKAFVDIGICRDITERVQMEQRMREAERMAYIGRLTTSLSHEIRNPLSAIKLNLQILKKNQHFSENDRRRLDISVTEVIRLEGILKELLDFAKPLHVHPVECHVNALLSACLDLLSAQFDQKQLTLVSSFDPDIPPLQADGEKLSQAIMNLLLNAFDASDHNGTIWVSSQYHRAEAGKRPTVEIAIEDDGCGIARKQLRNIFEPFFTTKSHGTGLGLTNVKRIIETHGGSIDAANRHPKGASFRVYLPV
ncbi:signal transduction histidine kinase [Candidatus Moduliflexus flocculans]|uniref:histidine kinase n=1 Tax=Candidatus Moduliflexus flocculans TaxID=1499966 RepID=A0A0S6VV59_9BACT|nr:signal transduction histidine kinase [Candidatus Moduliflexus flocculans]